ncbi:hypothetical protein G647_05466 [Cladophialophora carrionii CBS 160.54]|uniref:Uncharacterized protein n=1 Tax=Cladophialophora carrionii CBS 160.54 TaxID=1279043 RepID=V9D9R1_9EURO|nr:uncharacterized protein G647_05466 [Cladophialophora carrionii CBS 160.54]ETI23664.1 hypothetical protein G647_05466 [Cladophialophora carrionii CBS 160.54]
MVLNQADPDPIPDADNSTTYTARTPPVTVCEDVDEADADVDAKINNIPPSLPPSSVPWPGSTFIIRSIPSGQALTVLDGKVTLAPLGGRGSVHWACVETKGWLGFRNVVTGKFLGHDGKKGRLCCSVGWHRGWESFSPRLRPSGGFVLMMTHFERLWPVGVKVEHGVERLAKIEKHAGDAMVSVWEFIKV